MMKKPSRVISKKRAAVKRLRQRATPKQTQRYLDMVAAPGRPPGPWGQLRKATLTLDPPTMIELRRVGDGSMSEGTRRLAKESRAKRLNAGVTPVKTHDGL